MNGEKRKLRIAVQKRGRLQKPSFDFLKSLGLKFDNKTLGNLIVPCKNEELEVLLVRNSDIPEYVKNGVADFGIVGENVIYERNEKYNVIKKLGFGKCELVIAIPKNTNTSKMCDLNDERIATSYPNSLKRYLKQNSISASVIEIKGSVEITPTLNLSDAICDITQTGNTLRENNLKTIATILDSQAVLIESPFKTEPKEKFKKNLNI